jgi:hypothetical protein
VHRSLGLVLTLALALSSTILAGGCASTTTIEHVWRAPDWKGSFTHVAIFGMSKHEGVRRDFETSMVTAFANVGVEATASFELFPELDVQPTQEEIAARLEEHGIDAALVTRFVGLTSQAQYVGGAPYVVGPGVAGAPGFYGHYYGNYALAYGDQVVENEILTIETNLYDVAATNLVWSGLSETFAPETVDEVIGSYAQTMVTALVDAGLLTRTITPGAIEAHQ